MRQPVTHESRRVARGPVLLDEASEVDVQKDVRVVDDEGPPREKRFRVLERAAGAENRILGKEHDAIVPGRRRGPGAQQGGLPVQVDPDLAAANRGEPVQDALDDRRAEDRQERLGQVIRDRPQPLAQAGRREKDIERSGGHRYELILADPKQANSACEALPRPRNSGAIEQRPGSAGSLASAGGLGGPFEAPHVISRIYRAPRFPRPLRPCRRASRRSGRRG